MYAIDELREIVLPLASRRDITRVSVFGSCARDEADEHSDIDLLVTDRAASAGWEGGECRAGSVEIQAVS